MRNMQLLPFVTFDDAMSARGSKHALMSNWSYVLLHKTEPIDTPNKHNSPDAQMHLGQNRKTRAHRARKN